MAKSKETYLNVASTFKAKGDKLWAKACSAKDDNDDEKAGSLFKQARTAYTTAEKAKESAKNAE